MQLNEIFKRYNWVLVMWYQGAIDDADKDFKCTELFGLSGYSDPYKFYSDFAKWRQINNILGGYLNNEKI